MKQLSTDIEISAPAERVWQVLTDFQSFPDWNPFMPSATGEVKVGERLAIKMKPPKGMGMTFKPTVLKADEGRELRWIGRILMPGVFDGEHYFTIEPIGDDRVRFSQGETLTGLLVPLMGLLGVFKNTHLGFQNMNEALKSRAEGSSAS